MIIVCYCEYLSLGFLNVYSQTGIPEAKKPHAVAGGYGGGGVKGERADAKPCFYRLPAMKELYRQCKSSTAGND